MPGLYTFLQSWHGKEATTQLNHRNDIATAQPAQVSTDTVNRFSYVLLIFVPTYKQVPAFLRRELIYLTRTKSPLF